MLGPFLSKYFTTGLTQILTTFEELINCSGKFYVDLTHNIRASSIEREEALLQESNIIMCTPFRLARVS